ncbi:MAG: hypothetical protein C3F11_10750 [Methylocystaceae bacterium]|nr:MAG: hypothetical protein C3F11_10750 [Methylocystaceae bacterium]
MLMISPDALLRLRSETRAPVTLALIRPAPVKKLPRHRREAIVDALAAMMREAELTPFAIEGPGRAAIRARLCMFGWRWGQADAAADEAVQAALARVGAKRPDWKQGQPEWTQDGVTPQTRERCARCAKPLPIDDDAHWRKFCGPVCAQAAKVDRNRRRDKDERYAKEKIYRLAWAEKQQPRACKLCGTIFKPKRNNDYYCSRDCGDQSRVKAFSASRRSRGREMQMVCEAVRTE